MTQSHRPSVFVNGCFDLLHVGHIRFLEYASTFGDVTVGLNSDESIRKQKGKTRPIITAELREEMLYGLRSVKNVIIFDENSPKELLTRLYRSGSGPKFVIKSIEYFDQDFPEKHVINKYKGIIIYFSRAFYNGGAVSTTRIINEISSRSR